MTDELAQEFARICTETLGFLKDYGFGGGSLSKVPPVYQVSFQGKALVIECIWDDREDHLEMKVALLRDGRAPAQYAVDESGKRVRAHLLHILLGLGVRDVAHSPVLRGAPLPERWRLELGDYARLLKLYGGDILGEDPGVLDKVYRSH